MFRLSVSSRYLLSPIYYQHLFCWPLSSSRFFLCLPLRSSLSFLRDIHRNSKNDYGYAMLLLSLGNTHHALGASRQEGKEKKTSKQALSDALLCFQESAEIFEHLQAKLEHAEAMHGQYWMSDVSRKWILLYAFRNSFYRFFAWLLFRSSMSLTILSAVLCACSCCFPSGLGNIHKARGDVDLALEFYLKSCGGIRHWTFNSHSSRYCLPPPPLSLSLSPLCRFVLHLSVFCFFLKETRLRML